MKSLIFMSKNKNTSNEKILIYSYTYQLIYLSFHLSVYLSTNRFTYVPASSVVQMGHVRSGSIQFTHASQQHRIPRTPPILLSYRPLEAF